MSRQDLQIELIPCLSDNYAVLAHDSESEQTILVDAPDEKPILTALEKTGWALTHILITHHHWDHVQGLKAIKKATGAMVHGPASSMEKIAEIDHGLEDGDEFKIGDLKLYALGTPGHTLDHISYWLPDSEVAFTGDTLFVMGCGRVFEGSMRDMWFAVDKLAKLPPETSIYCGHEYTEANAKFCRSIEPGNEILKQREEEIKALRASGKPTVPTTILTELATNTFIRANHPDVKAALGMSEASDPDVFAEIRTRKDNF